MRGFQGKGPGGQPTHEASYQQLQVWHPRNSDIWEAQGCHCELISPLIIAAIRVKEELQLRASIKCHLLRKRRKWRRLRLRPRGTWKHCLFEKGDNIKFLAPHLGPLVRSNFHVVADLSTPRVCELQVVAPGRIMSTEDCLWKRICNGGR